MATGLHNLKLVEKQGEPKKKDERIALVHLFNLGYEKECGKKNPVPFSVCMKAMQFFRYDDKETGEIMLSYPDIDSWNEQLTGFFKDEFARNNRGFHFTYFLKQFGSFIKPQPAQRNILRRNHCLKCHREIPCTMTLCEECK